MAVLAAIGAIIAVGFFATNHIEFVRSPVKAVIPKGDDEIYTGSILFVPNDGKICRQFLFDNRSGRINDNGLVDCDHAYYQGPTGVPMQWSAARALVISEGFRRR
jgi:hypothetical protein